ncbi:MAG: hypothetical protein JXR51_03990 [Bacteroidales bacterium]|nr:hypothetical protein [Bacteroidales bacterium]MBN2756316.1 hypothetical protein [Bacteroidales bacterium]
MKPPICCLCNDRFEPSSGGLIYFTEDQDDKKHNEILKQPGYTGHPSNAFWFCEKHYLQAKKLSNLTKSEAFKILKSD